MGIWGQDWASFQSATPSTAGLSFAFTKVTQGVTYVNPEWVTQRNHAKAAGLVWGGYHYPDMANPVASEGDRFLAQVAFVPGDMAALDWEGYDKANLSVPHAVQAAYKEAWLRYVKARIPHIPVGMYCNLDYWRNIDKTGYFGDFLWIATADLPAGQPGISAPWLFHQYSASSVDKDYCHLPSTAALRTWALSFSEAPAVTTLAKADLEVLVNTDNVLDAPPDASDYATNKSWAWATHIVNTTITVRTLLSEVRAFAIAAKAAMAQILSQVQTNGSNGTSANTALSELTSKVDALAAAVAQLSATGLTQAQSDALADKIVTDLAARLQS
jgi:hypothetical protein